MVREEKKWTSKSTSVQIFPSQLAASVRKVRNRGHALYSWMKAQMENENANEFLLANFSFHNQ